MIVWHLQIKQQTPGGDWVSVCPTNKPPYEFNTREEAESAMRMFYPSQIPDEEVRVKEFEKR